MKVLSKVQEFIAEEDRAFDSAHASTLVQTKDGTVIAAWFGGSWEKAQDVCIWISRKKDKMDWEVPRKVADAHGIAAWNPVLFEKEDGTLVLFYKLGKDIPNWTTWYMESKDSGASFSEPRELVVGDISGGRGPVKNKPIILSSGRILAPASVEGELWNAFVDISDDCGKTWTKSTEVPVRRCSAEPRIIDRPYHPQYLYGQGVIQPSLWEDEAGEVHMFLRSTSSRIFRSDSKDRGNTWCIAYDTGLPNNNSGIDLVKMKNGDLVLVYNPRENLPGIYKGPRTPLTVAVSKDNGLSFEKLLDLETGVGSFAYPAIIATGEHEFMVTYTWNRKTIVYARVNYEG